MAIAVVCGCGQRHQVHDRSAGLEFTCYRCLKRVRIPGPEVEPKTPPKPDLPDPMTGPMEPRVQGQAG